MTTIASTEGRCVMFGTEKQAADEMAYQIARLTKLKIIDERSAASDAMLNYIGVGSIDGPKSVPEWVEKYEQRMRPFPSEPTEEPAPKLVTQTQYECEFCGCLATKKEQFDRDVFVCDNCSAD